MPATRGWSGPDRRQLYLRIVGAGLLLATGAVHLDLYLTGYRTIPTIGWLFLLQLITAFALGLGLLASRSRLLAAAGAAFALATLGGYLLSLRVGLFGFREVRTTAGIAAGVIEVVDFAALAAFVLGPLAPLPAVGRASGGPGLNRSLRSALPTARWGALAFSVLAAVLLGVSLAATGPVPTSAGASGALLKTTRIHGVAVLTNAQGYTLYWFAPDTPTRSACDGTSGRSDVRTGRRRSPMTATRCTPTSAIPPPARPTATTSTSTAAYGTRWPHPADMLPVLPARTSPAALVTVRYEHRCALEVEIAR